MLTTLLVVVSSSSSPTCNISIDSTDPRKGLVRAGDDITCINGVVSAQACGEACCNHNGSACLSFSFNDPWTLKQSYLGCINGSPCCCLKSSVPALEPNHWEMNITSGLVKQPPKLCKTCMDCNLNGECLPSGKCECDAGWADDDCGELNLVPAASLDGAYQHKVDLKDCSVSCGPSSWGGLPVKGPDNKYHLFASQFINNCTLAGWDRGSMVVRAVSDDPFGPYTYAETVFPTFHHNPTIRRLSPAQAKAGGYTGGELFVIYMIGDDAPPPSGKGAKCQSSDYNNHHLEGYISMAWSHSVFGPWNESKHALLGPGDQNTWDTMVTNPAPLFLEDGTAYLYFRGTQWPVNGYERIGVAKAASWKGPYGRVSDDPLWGPFDDQRKFVEDPWVWNSTRGYHMLSHGHFDEKGYYACAPTPEGPWQFRIKPSYTNVVKMADGTTQALVQRERPQLWFDETTGEPSILFTGVAPPGAKFYGYTYTFAQRIHQK